MGDLVIGLDLGTSGVRTIAVDLDGHLIAQTTRSYPLLTPHPGWTEQNPADWVEASLDTLSDIAQQIEGHRAIALGLSGQMHGLVPLDGESHVIRPALLWNDQRTGKAVEAIEAIIPRNDLIQRTGNPAITGFQLPKILWLRTESADAFERLHLALLPKDYLRYVLTGEAVTEPSDASGVGCLNLAQRQWDEAILSALQLNPTLFPPLVESGAIAGHLNADLAHQIGLPSGLPIIAGAGDNAAAAIGLGISSSQLNQGSVFESHAQHGSQKQTHPPIKPCQQGSLSIGTSGVIFVPCDRPTPDPEGRVHLFCHADGGYHLLGVTLAAGGALRWYRDTLAPQTSYETLMNQAEISVPGARGVLFLPHLAGERSPYLDPDARGAWVNLSLAHTQSDLVRAVLEGVAFSLRETLEVIQGITPVDQLLATGGGARSPLWLQILADILQTELIAPEAEEGAAYGAAILAMVGVGVYENVAMACQHISARGQRIQPQEATLYEGALQRYRQLYECLKPVR